MTQTRLNFCAGRSPANGRTIASKDGPSARKHATTGTHHLFKDSSSALNHEEDMLHHEMKDK